MTTVHICDYGSGNLFNVIKAFNHIGAKVELAKHGGDLKAAKVAVIPGVGAFSSCMRGLEDAGLDKGLCDFAESGGKILGICVGMQVLATFGEEQGKYSGLDLIPGKVTRLPTSSFTGQTLKTMNVGWNYVSESLGSGGADVRQSAPMYFVHSFQMVPDNPGHILSTTTFGGRTIAAMVSKENVFGVQFHPEKSGRSGLDFLRFFLFDI